MTKHAEQRDIEFVRESLAAMARQITGSRDSLGPARARRALERLEAELLTHREALRRAVYIAEHLFQMVPREVWREQGVEWMGQYEGDHWAEQTRQELASLASVAGSSGETE